MLSLNHFMMLLALDKEEAYSFAMGMNVAEIRSGLLKSDLKISERQIKRYIVTLKEYSYIAEGALNGHAKTYYLTEIGSAALDSMVKNPPNRKTYRTDPEKGQNQ